MHAPQTTSCWQGVGEGEQRVWSGMFKEGTTKAILQAYQGVGGGLARFCKIAVDDDCFYYYKK